jgi:thiol-disulfide isomerase/thioredoxin
MKKTLILLTILAIISCKEEPKVDYVIISGKITNKEKGDVSIMTYDRSFEEKLDISDEGTFVDTVDVKESSYVLYDGKNPVFLYLEPGYNLNISYDAKDFDKSISINGKGSETSNYLVLKRKNEKNLIGKAEDLYTLSENDYKAKLNFIADEQQKILDSLKGIPIEFKQKEKRNLNYFNLRLLIDYEDAHKEFTKKTDFTVSNDFLEELNSLDYSNEEDYEFSNFYKSLVRKHYEKEANKIIKRDSIGGDMAFIKTVSNIKSEIIKNGLLFEHATYSMGYSKNVEAYYKSFIENSTNEKNNKIITEKYNKLVGLKEGRPSPQFKNYENYKGGTTSLEDLKGKYVYIDVWATWCGPCIAEIPSLKKVEKEFHGKNIEFVSISIDRASDHEKWKTMVAAKELSGIQLFADSDWNSGFVKDYQINGIPRFILIDPDGNIVNSNAPRPSNPRLVELFTELNI